MTFLLFPCCDSVALAVRYDGCTRQVRHAFLFPSVNAAVSRQQQVSPQGGRKEQRNEDV